MLALYSMNWLEAFETPREIPNVSADSKSICDILDRLKRFFEESKDSELASELTQSLHILLENTCCVAEELVGRTKPFVTEKGHLKKSKWGGIKCYYYEDVEQLGTQLSNGKSTLKMILEKERKYAQGDIGLPSCVHYVELSKSSEGTGYLYRTESKGCL
jgi:hypothetical protein